jgi:Fe-S-cluster containining protein
MTDEVPFDCAMCGRCCSQRLILLNTEDVFRLADHFKMTVPVFMEKYGVVFATTEASKKPRLYLKVAGEKCPFFADNKCSIHPVKPLICRLFPGISPRQTAGDLKAFVNKHALSDDIKACKIFSMPDDQRVAYDRDAMITSAIYDSVETP